MLGKDAKLNREGSMAFIVTLIVIMWGTFLTQKAIPQITNYGLQHRSLVGLVGIITAPFLHLNLSHIISNTIGLFLFGLIYTAIEGKQTMRVVLAMIVYSGLIQWIVGGSGNHIGMSGIIFGLYGFLLTVGIFHKNLIYLATSAFILLAYGSMLLGLLNVTSGVSFSGHLVGFLVGIMIAKWKEN